MDKSHDKFFWHPTEELKNNSNLAHFLASHQLADYDELLAKADSDPQWFWSECIKTLDMQFYEPPTKVMDLSKGIEWPQWCVGGKTNFALNCLDKHKGTPVWDKTVIEWEGEDGARRAWTLGHLNEETCKAANALRALGLGKGDCIGIYMPMIPETAAAFLAVTKIGGIVIPLFSGFGTSPISVRLNDGKAKAVFTADGTYRRGSVVPLKDTISEAAKEIPSLEHIITFKRMGNDVIWEEGRDHWWHDIVSSQSAEAETEVLNASDPMMLAYTSGTSGMPKGTVSSQISLILKGLSDLSLLMDFNSDDKLLWMSDFGWIVGPMAIGVTCYFGATFVMTEGTPNYPDAGRIWRLIDDYKITYMGIAPTIARMYMSAPPETYQQHDVSSLRMTLSTGEPWTPDAWIWLMENICKGKAPILNYSGGTEISGGILGTTPLHSLKPCSFGGPLPGMGVDIVDDDVNTVEVGKVGELIMRKTSPGLTIGLWNNPDKYIESYWSYFPGVWRQGDWASRDADGCYYISGRSDDTLKISGKRTGPAEIEGLLMQTTKLADCAVVGIPDDKTGSAIVCVCIPKPGIEVNDALKAELSEVVVKGHGKSFLPKRIYFVEDLPRTNNLKIMRRVIKAAICGKNPGDLSSLVNPETVEYLIEIADL